MTKGHKTFTLRGGADAKDFPSREISLKDVRAVARVAWEKWGHMAADWSIRELIGLAYAEGIWHGAMIGAMDHPDLLSTIGMTENSASSAVESAASPRTIATERPTARDLLESL